MCIGRLLAFCFCDLFLPQQWVDQAWLAHIGMAKGSNGEHFLLIVLSFRRECLASKRFNTHVRDYPHHGCHTKILMLQSNTSLTYYLRKNFHLSTLNSCSPVRQVKFRHLLADLEHLIHRELVFLTHSKTKGKHFIKLTGNRWKTCRAPSLAIPKLAFSLRNCRPALLFWIEKLNQELKFFKNIFT